MPAIARLTLMRSVRPVPAPAGSCVYYILMLTFTQAYMKNLYFYHTNYTKIVKMHLHKFDIHNDIV